MLVHLPRAIKLRPFRGKPPPKCTRSAQKGRGGERRVRNRGRQSAAFSATTRGFCAKLLRVEVVFMRRRVRPGAWAHSQGLSRNSNPVI